MIERFPLKTASAALAASLALGACSVTGSPEKPQPGATQSSVNPDQARAAGLERNKIAEVGSAYSCKVLGAEVVDGTVSFPPAVERARLDLTIEQSVDPKRIKEIDEKHDTPKTDFTFIEYTDKTKGLSIPSEHVRYAKDEVSSSAQDIYGYEDDHDQRVTRRGNTITTTARYNPSQPKQLGVNGDGVRLLDVTQNFKVELRGRNSATGELTYDGPTQELQQTCGRIALKFRDGKITGALVGRK